MLSSFLLIPKSRLAFLLRFDTALLSHADPGVSQQTKSKKDASVRPGRKRVRVRNPKVKDKAVGGKFQSILTQVLDKGHFLRLGDSIILNPGKTLELRCKGSKISWVYPTYLDTFNDSRLRYVNYFAQLLHSQVLVFIPFRDHVTLFIVDISRPLV